MDELEISYSDMHNILKENKKKKYTEKNKILAKSILYKGFIFENQIENAMINKLSKSFTNNYFHKWKLSQKSVSKFELKEEEWLKNVYKPFTGLNLQCAGLL